MAAIHISISGSRGRDYLEGMPQKRELQFASRAVNRIDINGSLYAQPEPGVLP